MGEFEYDFGYGELYAYNLYQPSEIETAQAAPGIYAWFVRTPLTDSLEDKCDPYRKVFSARRFRVQAKAPLGEELIGTVKRTQPGMGGSAHMLHQALFASTFAVFAPPIYIGRSQNIRTRLRQHMDALQEVLDAPMMPSTSGPAPDPDSELESGQFGARVGKLLRSRGIKDSRSLYIKVVYAPDNDSTKKVEYVLNRTFHPIMGRL